MTKCPSCGHGNVAGTQFCEMCGEELSDATAAAPAAPAAGAAGVDAGGASAGTIKCPACDNENPSDNVVCEVCGTELRPGAAGSIDTLDATAASASGTVPGMAATAPMDPASTSATPAASASDASPVTSTATPFDAAISAGTPSATSSATSPMGTDAADAAMATNSGAAMPVVAVSTADPGAAGGMPAVSTPAVDPLMGASTTADPPVASMDPASTVDPLASAVAPVAPVAPDVPAAPVAPAAPAAGGVLEPGRVKMVVEQGMTIGKQFVLGDAEVLVGREDAEDGIYPDIDLSDQDEGYVHRKHATLKFENGGLSVTHLGGANKTRVNNRPLDDNTPAPVQIGDKVAFGKVVLRVQSL